MTTRISKALKIALMGGLAGGLAACSTVRDLVPFGNDGPTAVASEGVRIPVLEFQQQLAPSAALSGRDFFLPGPQAVTSHPVPGGNLEQSGVHAIAGETFTVAWRRSIGEGSSRSAQIAAPLVAEGGRVFAMDGRGSISAIDAATGAVVWQVNRSALGGDRGFGGGIALAAGKVFVVTGGRVVAALDQATGQIVWRQDIAAPIHSAPTVAGSRMYAIDVDNQLIAFDTATGEQSWTFQGITEPARILRATTPAVTGDTVIAAFSSGEIVALRASNGQQLWQQGLSRASRTNALSEIRDIAGRPVVSRGFVYAVSHSGAFGSLDARTGQPRWNIPVAGVNAPLVIGDVAYVVSNTGELVVVNQLNGQIYWTRDLNEGRERKVGGFLGIGDRIARPQWSGPILASNRLVLVNSDGEAVGLDPKTGAQVASVDLGAPAFIAPMAYNGAIYVLTDDGRVVSIR